MDLAQAVAATTRRARAVDTAVVTGTAGPARYTVNASGTDEIAWCPIHLTPQPGDVVMVMRAPMGAAIVAVFPFGTDQTVTPQPLPAESSSGVSYFTADFAWSWSIDYSSAANSWAFSWSPQLSAGKTASSGGTQWATNFFYQSKVAAALAGVTVDAARVRLALTPTGSGNLSVFTSVRSIWPTTPDGNDDHSRPVMPDVEQDAPRWGTSLTAVSAGWQWIDIGALAGQSLVNDQLMYSPGWGAGTGICVVPPLDDAPTRTYITGPTEDASSGLVEITWHR